MTVYSNSDQYNKDVYSTEFAAERFQRDIELQEPEKVVINLLKDDLSDMAMLDIGVGTGRTTPHFSPLVSEYVGTDYSSSMIDACRRNFPNPPSHVSFEVCDATSMEMFEDNSFDFLLFSYNGIDVLSHKQRLRVFEEVKRIAKHGAYFCFSSHNLLSAKKMFFIYPHRNYKRFWMSIKRCVLTRLANSSYKRISERPWAIIKEPTHVFKLWHYFIKPHEQIKQLEEAGFTDVQVFELDGKKLTDDQVYCTEDGWIYYLCRVSKH